MESGHSTDHGSATGSRTRHPANSTDDGAHVGHHHDGTVAARDAGEGTHSGGGHIGTGSVVHRGNHGIGHPEELHLGPCDDEHTDSPPVPGDG